MNKLLVALYDTQGYMKALAEYFGKKNFLLASRLFTKAESLNDFLKERQPDVLLLGQDVDRTGLKHLDHVKQLVILSEGNCVSEGREDYPLIFKYQSAENILKEIFAILEEGTPKESGIAGKMCGRTEIWGIYHPYQAPPTMQQICPEQGDSGKRCLRISMELLGGEEYKDLSGDDRGLSEIIFYLKQKNERLALKLRQLVQQSNGMDHIRPVTDFRDLYSLCREDVDRLLTVISGETGYERVIFDIGFLTDTALYLLYCCDRIYIPKAQSLWEEKQANSLERLLVKEGLEEVLESIRYIAV